MNLSIPSRTLPAPSAAAAALLAALAAACSGPAVSQEAFATVASPPVAARPVPAPLELEGTAYEAAAELALPALEATDHVGLHNLYRLSDDILSGSEPEGHLALEHLAELGIRTILSVDGKAPEHEAAAILGMRYVHVPIRYHGIEPEEQLAIAKTFRELEGPFYVHCFHGKHRGPAAAAIGRVVRDGAPREQAIAEMRQYCGTSSSYEGLYATIAAGDLPSAEQTAAFEFDFAPEHRVEGLRQAMVELPRSFDLLVDMSERDWQPKADHPDANARNEAAKLVELFEQLNGDGEVLAAPADFRRHVAESIEHSKALVRELEQAALGPVDGRDEANDAAREALQALRQVCRECHREYRN